MSNIFYPNSGFYISGEDLSAVSSIKWGSTSIDTDRLIFDGTSGISGALPPNIKTDTVYVINQDGSASSLGEQVVHLLDNHKIQVSNLDVASAGMGENITIKGSNFYNITNVTFGAAQSEFNLVSPSEIEAIVPKAAEHTGVTVFSSFASGVTGTSFNSGISANNFIPIPQLYSATPEYQIEGNEITVVGESLGAVKEVRFKGVPDAVSVTNRTRTTFNVSLPINAVRGSMTLILENNDEIIQDDEVVVVSPAAIINRVLPDTGVIAGQNIFIEGTGFRTGILSYNTGQESVKIKIGDTDVSGFKIIDPALMSGVVPNTTPLGNQLVSLYSQDHEIYPSGKIIDISGALPEVLGANPSFATSGQLITVTGNNLSKITKVNLSRNDNTGVSAVVTGSGVTTSSFADRVTFRLPSGIQQGEISGRGSFYLDISVSGDYGGSDTLTSGLFVIGAPFVQEVIGGVTAPREPSSTGVVSGLNLLKNSRIDILNSVTEELQASVKATGVLGSGNYVTKSFFKFPSEFTSTGIKLRYTNIAAVSNTSSPISVFKRPVVSGFTPLSGEEGTVVTVSGFFSGLKDNQVTISNIPAENITQTSTTGIQFTIPTNINSDFVNVITSGGNASSDIRFSSMPSRPFMSQFIPNTGDSLSYSVFGAGNRIDIIGDNLNIVDEVLFYDKEGNDIIQRSFASKSAKKISLDLPKKTVTRTNSEGTFEVDLQTSSEYSGVARLKDRFSRVVTGSQEFRVAELSGISGNYAVFGEEITLTGLFFSGLNASFSDEFGATVSGDFVGTTKFSESGFSITTKVPRDITRSTLLVSGSNNPSILSTTEEFFPLPTITGVSGDSNFNFNLDQRVQITGINSFGNFGSGDSVIGITGEGQSAFYPINSFSRISGSDGKNLSLFDFTVNGSFTGSGQMFILSPWEDYKSGSFSFESTKTNENLNKIITSDFYNIVYPAPSISGIATGNKFNGNVSGFISGSNLKPVTGVFLSGSGLGVNVPANDFVNVSNNLIRFAPPFGPDVTGSGFLVVESERGIGTSEISGGEVQIFHTVGISSFSPLEGITGSTVNIVGSGFSQARNVIFGAVGRSGNASFTINSDSGISATVPQFTITEGQDAEIKIEGLLTDNFTTSSRFTIIHDAPTVQFNVVSGRAAPTVGTDRSAIFTIVENIGGTDYYVTKMVNPDGKEIIMNTEEV